ncbi:MAG: SpvB/TcaC N-terminal domain-containing protein [Candidatus Omnitrophota bacterium]
MLFFVIVIPAFAQTELPILSVSSSDYYRSYYPSNTIDGNLSSYWRGRDRKSYWWVEFDLGMPHNLSQISIHWNKSYGSSDYDIQGSNDGNDWTNLHVGLSSLGGSVNPYRLDYGLNGSFRYVRIYIHRVQNRNPRIFEVKLYGADDIDTTPPTGSITIDNGAAYTDSTLVALDLSATDSGSGVSQMQFSNDGSSWLAPEAYSTNKAWVLESADGTKTVYVKFSDVAGNWSNAVTDTIVLDTAEPPPPPPPSESFFGEYYNNPSGGSGPSFPSGASDLTREDWEINFDWGTNRPDSSISDNNFMVRWTKTEYFTAGEYEFTVNVDDGVRLWIDSILIIDEWIDQAPTLYSNNINIPAGNHTIKMEYYENGGGAVAQLSYELIGSEPDTTPPFLSINPVISPTNQNIILSYIVSDDVTLPEQIVVTGNNSPYVNEGNYNITLTAQDLAGNTSTDSVSFTIDKSPPVVVISSPANGAIVDEPLVILAGTVDGSPFSESRNLFEGENTLTKDATDAAGNTGSDSITVHLYLGVSIGSEGGEVVSSDGKVKVVIPEGALSETRQIQILTVDKEALEQAIPNYTSLLSVVECKPYGLVFNEEIEIIYTLNQGEVPGTPVELGLYDSIQNEIIPTGKTSVVPVDSYTVSFSIIHFSTYAALKNLTPQGIPIGGGVKVPLPDLFTGAFSHAIPITVPPGRKGMQPALGLTYRSSSGNSWVGMGFSFDPGHIVRSTRSGPPSYIDEQDTFYFVTDGGTTELVHLIDNLYQAKIESSFTKFFKEPDDSWKVVGKDGSVLRLGELPGSKETSSQGTFSWYMTKAVDTNGNYIEYIYTEDQGKSYLSRIDYTGNEIGISPTNSVEFFSEARDDVSSSYISTSKIATAKRLKEIEIRMNNDLVWRYVLGYEYSQDTSRSLLKSVTQSASDGTALPTQNFTYQTAN